MQVVYLILYLWHAGSFVTTSGGGANGGPVLTLQQMPSMAACEAVGTSAKGLADSQRQSAPAGIRSDSPGLASPPAVYRCIEVPK